MSSGIRSALIKLYTQTEFVLQKEIKRSHLLNETKYVFNMFTSDFVYYYGYYYHLYE
jgi:hypothetical protein